MNGLRTKLKVPIAILSLTWALVGCNASGDTSGYKAEQKLTKDQINQQIADIKANKNMPDNVKDMAIKNLEQQLPSAR
jgi:Tfp pilus assembly protein PilO